MKSKREQKQFFKLIIVTIALWVAAANTPVSAASRDTQKALLPPDAEVVTKEQRKMQGSAFDFTFFTTNLGPGSVKDFYRQRLASSGWKEKDPMKDASALPGFQIPPELAGLMGNNVIFEKGEQKIIINILPAGYSPDNKTRCIYASGKHDFEKKASDDDFVPSLMRKPKKEVAPVYPGASLIELSEEKDSMKATYFVPTDIETALTFYQINMGDFGWTLTEEAPLNTREFPEYELSTVCPTCPKDMKADLSGYKSKYAVLGFKTDKAETCRIVFSSVVNDKETLDVALRSTSVILHYQKGGR